MSRTIKQVGVMYEMLLSMKALEIPVKLDLRIPCRTALLLAMAVEQGVSGTDPGRLFRKVVSVEDQGKLMELTLEILKKAELEELYIKLKELGQG